MQAVRLQNISIAETAANMSFFIGEASFAHHIEDGRQRKPIFYHNVKSLCRAPKIFALIRKIFVKIPPWVDSMAPQVQTGTLQ